MKFKKPNRKRLSPSQMKEKIEGQKKYLQAKQSILAEFYDKQINDGFKHGVLVLTEEKGNMRTVFTEDGGELFKVMSPMMKELFHKNKDKITVVFFDEPDEWHGYSISRPDSSYTMN